MVVRSRNRIRGRVNLQRRDEWLRRRKQRRRKKQRRSSGDERSRREPASFIPLERRASAVFLWIELLVPRVRDAQQLALVDLSGQRVAELPVEPVENAHALLLRKPEGRFVICV